MAHADSPLHHYTSGIGLAGIAKSNKIWASSLKTMNDTREFLHTLDLAKQYLTIDRPGATSDQLLNAMFAQYLSRLVDVDVYVACFSEREDCLSMWRCYCPAGFGYSLGFNRAALEQIATTTKFSLRKCVYDLDDQRRLIKEWADSAIRQLEDTSNGVPLEIHARMPGNWNISGLVELASYLKDPSFVDEQEWRLVSSGYISAESLHYRPANSYLVPYIEIDLSESSKDRPISELWIGPTPNVQTAYHSAKLIANTLRVPPPQLSKSPYRAW
jgi:hypothetical protein